MSAPGPSSMELDLIRLRSDIRKEKRFVVKVFSMFVLFVGYTLFVSSLVKAVNDHSLVCPSTCIRNNILIGVSTVIIVLAICLIGRNMSLNGDGEEEAAGRDNSAAGWCKKNGFLLVFLLSTTLMGTAAASNCWLVFCSSGR